MTPALACSFARGACHLQVQPRLYVCPQCHGRSCGLPSRCELCALPLVSASVLSRAFRSVLPLPPFQVITTVHSGRCKGCQQPLQRAFACQLCQQTFCQAAV